MREDAVGNADPVGIGRAGEEGPQAFEGEWPWPHFSRRELACHHCGALSVDPGFMRRLEHLRADFGRPMPVNSGYRCPDHDREVRHARGQATTGPHATGHAVDVHVYGADAFRLVSLAAKHGITGIGVNQRGDVGDRFLHLDDLKAPTFPRPGMWTY